MKTPSFLLIAACCLSALLAACGGGDPGDASLEQSAAATPTWSRSTPGAYGAMLALDADGNVLVAGSIPYTTIVTQKYDPVGTLLWQQVFDNPGTREQASWIALDGAGNAIVAGYLVTGESHDPSGFVVLKYDPAGALRWQDVVPVTFGRAIRVETDAAGNAYVTGRGWLAGAATYTDYLTMKYAPDGTRLWLRAHGLGTAADVPASLAVTPDGKVAVTGSPSGGSPMVTVVYDTDGNVLWSRSEPAGTARDVAFGPGGEVYVAGGTGSLVVVKHDAAGNVAWTAGAPGFSAVRIGLDAAGNVLATGIAHQTQGMPYTDWITAKFDPAGALVWSQRYDAHDANDEVPRSLAVAADGAVIVTGQGGPGPASGTLSYLQMVTVEYTAAGVPAWIATTFDTSTGVGVRNAGASVFAVGQYAMLTFRFERAAPAPAAPAPAPPAPAPPPPTTEPAPPPPAVVTPTMKVADVSLAAVRRTNTKFKVAGTVALRDSAGAAVAGAAVTATFTTPVALASTATGTTDAAGNVTFVAAGRAGTYTLQVKAVTKAGWAFDAAGSVLSRSITVP